MRNKKALFGLLIALVIMLIIVVIVAAVLHNKNKAVTETNSNVDTSGPDTIIINPKTEWWQQNIGPNGGRCAMYIRVLFKDYDSLYSFDVSDIELFYDGGDENKGNLKPGSSVITEKNKHVITGMGDSIYPMSWAMNSDGTKDYRTIKIENKGNYDMFNVSLEIPMRSENEFELSTWEYYANVSCEKKSKIVDGVTNYYWEIKQLQNMGDYKGCLHPNENKEMKCLKYIPESKQLMERIEKECRLIFYTNDLKPKTDDLEYYRIKASADMKDFAGTITGSAFTGGAIGYTLLADSTEQKYAYNKAEELRKAVAGAGSVDAAATAVCGATGKNTSEVQLYVTGTVGNANATGAGKVMSGTYVGGIVGYNDANTFMYIDQAVSYASVTADTGYAGGIISASRKSNNKIQTSNFYGSVTAKEAAGGIAGENQGTISKCNVTNATITGGNGTSVASYGGIAGVNGIASTKTGDVDAVKAAGDYMLANGVRRVIPLAVSGAFHSKYMEKAGEQFKAYLADFELNDAKLPVYTNVDAEATTSASDFKAKMPMQIHSSVHWTQTIQKMIAQGVDTFVEIGPGKVLAGLNRKISSDITTYNIFDKATLENTVNALKEQLAEV